MAFTNKTITHQGIYEKQLWFILPLYPGELSDCRGGILILRVFALYKIQLFAHCLSMGPTWNEGEQKDFL